MTGRRGRQSGTAWKWPGRTAARGSIEPMPGPVGAIGE